MIISTIVSSLPPTVSSVHSLLTVSFGKPGNPRRYQLDTGESHVCFTTVFAQSFYSTECLLRTLPNRCNPDITPVPWQWHKDEAKNRAGINVVHVSTTCLFLSNVLSSKLQRYHPDMRRLREDPRVGKGVETQSVLERYRVCTRFVGLDEKIARTRLMGMRSRG